MKVATPDPLTLTTLLPETVPAGADPFSVNVTVPEVIGLFDPSFTVAVNVTATPERAGLWFDVMVVVLGFPVLRVNVRHQPPESVTFDPEPPAS